MSLHAPLFADYDDAGNVVGLRPLDRTKPSQSIGGELYLVPPVLTGDPVEDTKRWAQFSKDAPPNATIVLRPGITPVLFPGWCVPKSGQTFDLNGCTIKRANQVTGTLAGTVTAGAFSCSLTLATVGNFFEGQEVSWRGVDDTGAAMGYDFYGKVKTVNLATGLVTFDKPLLALFFRDTDRDAGVATQRVMQAGGTMYSCGDQFSNFFAHTYAMADFQAAPGGSMAGYWATGMSRNITVKNGKFDGNRTNHTFAPWWTKHSEIHLIAHDVLLQDVSLDELAAEGFQFGGMRHTQINLRITGCNGNPMHAGAVGGTYGTYDVTTINPRIDGFTQFYTGHWDGALCASNSVYYWKIVGGYIRNGKAAFASWNHWSNVGLHADGLLIENTESWATCASSSNANEVRRGVRLVNLEINNGGAGRIGGDTTRTLAQGGNSTLVDCYVSGLKLRNSTIAFPGLTGGTVKDIEVEIDASHLIGQGAPGQSVAVVDFSACQDLDIHDVRVTMPSFFGGTVAPNKTCYGIRVGDGNVGMTSHNVTLHHCTTKGGMVGIRFAASGAGNTAHHNKVYDPAVGGDEWIIDTGGQSMTVHDNEVYVRSSVASLTATLAGTGIVGGWRARTYSNSNPTGAMLRAYRNRIILTPAASSGYVTGTEFLTGGIDCDGEDWTMPTGNTRCLEANTAITGAAGYVTLRNTKRNTTAINGGTILPAGFINCGGNRQVNINEQLVAAQTSGTTLPVGDSVRHVHLSHGATLAALTLQLPHSTAACLNNNEAIVVTTDQAVTSLAFSTPVITVDAQHPATNVPAARALAAGGSLALRWLAATNTWVVAQWS